MQIQNYMRVKLLCRASSSKAVSIAPDKLIDPTTPVHVKLEKIFGDNKLSTSYTKRTNLIDANRIENRFRNNENFLRSEFLAEGEVKGENARLYDYYKMGKYVQQLKSSVERIDFINPYERDWTKSEQRWHRPFHPRLLRPRRAWSMQPIPEYFDTLDFYKYLTKMRVVEDKSVLDNYYDDKGLTNFPLELFEKNLVNLLITFGITKKDLKEEHVNEFLRSMMEIAQISFPSRIAALSKYRISTSERCESFWIRSGFRHMYECRKIWMDNTSTVARYRFPGDDRYFVYFCLKHFSRKLGELSFVMRDKHVVQLRTTSNDRLKPIYLWDDKDNLHMPIFDDNRQLIDVLYNPLVFNLHLDGDVLFQCPGFDYESPEQFQYGHLAIKNIFALNKLFNNWGIYDKEYYDHEEYLDVFKDNLQSISVSTLFSWLNAQAHCLGYTQYTDLDKEPLVSQLIISDGINFHFALGQLNTIAINVDVDGFENERTNVCLVDGPYSLFDRFDELSQTFYHKTSERNDVEGLNKEVMLRFVQMIL